MWKVKQNLKTAKLLPHREVFRKGVENMKIREIAKKVVLGTLVLTMILAGVSVSVKEAKAATAYEYQDEIVYTSVDNAATLYASNEAPTKPGYVFGGWFSDDKGTTQIIDEAEPSTLYAKFVPAYVLSVKAQNHIGVSATSTSGTMRVVSSVDNKAHYEKVGFDIYFGNKIEEGYKLNAEGKTVYNKILVNKSGTIEEYVPTQVFGAKAGYFNIAEIKGIGSSSFKSTIYVKPYWVTNDGTKVYGIGKYVCVQDGIDGIISIPINIHTAQNIAAGIVELTYPEELTFYETADDPGYRIASRLLDEMSVYVDEENHTIKCVGIGSSVNSKLAADSDLYISLRFKAANSSVTVGQTRLNFTIKSTQFCNWEEQILPMSDYIWDIQY